MKFMLIGFIFTTMMSCSKHNWMPARSSLAQSGNVMKKPVFETPQEDQKKEEPKEVIVAHREGDVSKEQGTEEKKPEMVVVTPKIEETIVVDKSVPETVNPVVTQAEAKKEEKVITPEVKVEFPKIEIPKIDVPKIEIPKIEIPQTVEITQNKEEIPSNTSIEDKIERKNELTCEVVGEELYSPEAPITELPISLQQLGFRLQKKCSYFHEKVCAFLKKGYEYHLYLPIDVWPHIKSDPEKNVNVLKGIKVEICSDKTYRIALKTETTFKKDNEFKVQQNQYDIKINDHTNQASISNSTEINGHHQVLYELDGAYVEKIYVAQYLNSIKESRKITEPLYYELMEVKPGKLIIRSTSNTAEQFEIEIPKNENLIYKIISKTELLIENVHECGFTTKKDTVYMIDFYREFIENSLNPNGAVNLNLHKIALGKIIDIKNARSYVFDYINTLPIDRFCH